MQKVMSFNDLAIVSVNEIDYETHFGHMNKDEVITIMKISILQKNVGAFRNINVS